MFIKYQKVRNAVVGTATAVVGGIAAFFGLSGDGEKPPQRDDSHAVAVSDSHGVAPSPISTPAQQSHSSRVAEEHRTVTAETNDFDLNTSSSLVAEPAKPRTPVRVQRAPKTKEQMYVEAMKFANAPASPTGKGKDVLGRSSPWKLNLYDDDKDGQWDRGKLDYDRDEVDDEKWNFKKSRWEKNGGELVWSGKKWTRESKSKPNSVATKQAPRTVTKAERYVSAMKIAMAAASPTGKGKDVLGPSSPWKLNLYDDDKDGQWDRGKLDYNRDEVDDEKWNFKKGRWEKDGGATTWNGSKWTSSKVAARKAPPANSKLALYRRAMKIATSRAPSSKGKDVLGSSSPWKLNLYDDNGDGQWDRGKLDYNRDEVDDEKWNFKKGRWEKDGGSTIWDGSNWATSGK